jgi:hypothetical protein
LWRFYEEVADSSHDNPGLSNREEILLEGALDAMDLWLKATSGLIPRPRPKIHPLEATPPSLENLGPEYKTIWAAIEYLGGWDVAASLQHYFKTERLLTDSNRGQESRPLEQADTKKLGSVVSKLAAAEKASYLAYFNGCLPSDWSESDDSGGDASNSYRGRALVNAVIWRRVQRKQAIEALALLCYKWLQDSGFEDLPDPREIDEVLSRVYEEVAVSTHDGLWLSRPEEILLDGTSDASDLWLETTSGAHPRVYPLEPTPPPLKDLGDKCKAIWAAIEYLGGWEVAVSLQHYLFGKK